MKDINLGEFFTLDKFNKTIELRNELHNNPEISGKEKHTRQIIYNFLKENTKLKVYLTDEILYAFYDNNKDKSIAIRSDHDAILDKNAKAFHGCGHDGHTAIACGLAMVVDKLELDKNVLFIFQPSEEDGSGALKCLHLISEYNIDYIYGLHNFPGYELGRPILKSGTFMCASSGMSINFEGKQSHASEPEEGINPAYAISEIVKSIESLSTLDGYKDLDFEERVFATVVHINIGHDGAYGVSPANGKLELTLRGNKLLDLSNLQRLIENKAKYLSEKYKLKVKIAFSDEFPDTSNSKEEVDFLDKVFTKNGLNPIYWEDAYRASEDFGWYLKEVPGVFFGMGIGENSANLHQEDYCFNDDLIKPSIEALALILINK